MQNISPAILHGTMIELQCPAGHRSWLAMEDVHLVCVACGAAAARTGRLCLSVQAGKRLCGCGTSPRMRTIPEKAAAAETYTLHLDVPSLNKFLLD